MIEFFYFDLGRVLLDFSHELGCEQIATAANLTVEQVKATLFGDNELSNRTERGEFTTAEFHANFCEATKSKVSLEAFSTAWSDIFSPIPESFQIAEDLRSTGHRLGILSNTCAAHWDFAAENFSKLEQIFDPIITSYDVGAMKPDSAIYEAAADAAKCKPKGLFFVDDRLENVEGARAAGWTAHQFESPKQLAAELELLGVTFNH